jgi:hypothetical protein
MSKFELNSGDVVSMELKQSIAGLQTFRIDQLHQTLKEHIRASGIPFYSPFPSWLGEDVECELLSASLGRGWKKGKVRIRFEFVEDEPEQPENPDFPVISSDVEQMDQ